MSTDLELLQTCILEKEELRAEFYELRDSANKTDRLLNSLLSGNTDLLLNNSSDVQTLAEAVSIMNDQSKMIKELELRIKKKGNYIEHLESLLTFFISGDKAEIEHPVVG